MSNFTFLQAEWPAFHEAAAKAEAAVNADPRTTCFYARRALEIAVRWAFKHDPALRLPYQDNLSALIHEPTFKQAIGEAVFTKTRLIVKIGNNAVHADAPLKTYDATMAVRELFHVAYWLAHTYARGARPAPGLAFDPAAVPKETTGSKQTAEQLQKLQAELQQKDENLIALLADKGALDEELKQLRAEVAAAKKTAPAVPDTHDYSEDKTRAYFIDLLLREAGWPLNQARDREFEVVGMPNGEGKGFVDYVLWGDDGKPLGLVEAKRARKDPRVGQQQAKLYADCLEATFGQRPVIFYTNGYEHWIWDDASYPPRRVQGFYKKTELELLIQRRASRKSLATAAISSTIVERFYHTRAIRAIGESFDQDRDRKALVVMATGAGKTRTVIALSDLLMRCNWAKRVLFLADRVALVNQAVNAFKAHLPEAGAVNLVTEKETEGRVYASTYPTMMGLIDETKDGKRRFGVGHFDLIVIDEAHRSVFQKYRAIFEYFDSLLVGLTATPKDEVDRNTYSLFDLESGVPTDAYSLDEAVADGYLVPPRAVSVPLKFQREGIRYEQLSEDEREQWDALEWDEEGDVPDYVDADAVNKWLFNVDTVDKVLAHLMTRGLRVAGGDQLGKTILFAKNQAHAEFIAERFNTNYPHFKGEFARVITFKTEYAQSLIEAFSNPVKAPQIALSVDMLDTGIDVPEVVNLVFFKLVRSKTKFWQMVGRGTRLRPDLFGLGQDKEFFYIFDYCQNLEFFSQDLPDTEGSLAESLGTRLFKRRLELLAVLDDKLKAEGVAVTGEMDATEDPSSEAEVRRMLATRLRAEVYSMNPENFVVRPKLQLVEAYSKPEAWKTLSEGKIEELTEEIAGLPTQLPREPEEAKRFDVLLLTLQLALLRGEPSFTRLRDRVRELASHLEGLSAIPMVKEQMVLIQDLQTGPWWEDVTLPMLESVRRRLRGLVGLIERRQRTPIYSNFEDELGSEVDIDLPGTSLGDFQKFRAKARLFLQAHADHVTIQKLRLNHQLTTTDLEELERMFAESGTGTAEHVQRAAAESDGLGLFVRSLIGMDRGAAKEAMGAFLEGKTFSANQIRFVDLLLDHLTAQGSVPISRLYEPPFTDLSAEGLDGLFPGDESDALVSILEEVRRRAVA